MSLISDALKEAQKKREARRNIPSPPILPPPETKEKRRKLSLVFTIFIVLILLFSGFLYIQMNRIVKNRAKNVIKPLSSSGLIETPKYLPENQKKGNEAILTQQSEEGSNTQPLKMPETGKKEVTPTPVPSIISQPQTKPPRPPQFNKPDKPEEEDMTGKIEIIRSLISSTQTSTIEKELEEIKKIEREGDWQKACSLWEKILKKAEKKEYFLNAGVAFKKAGNFSRAEELFLKSLNYEPDYIPALNNLGVLYLEVKNYDKAIFYLLNALKLSESDPEIYINTGIAYFKKNDYAKSKIYLEGALKLDGNLFQPCYYLGIIYLNEKEKSKALFYFNKLLELAPDTLPSEIRDWVKRKVIELKSSLP
ncbi:MAG: tetratricopeptide repeat protein [Candidatus Aminicenantia bacterium]